MLKMLKNFYKSRLVMSILLFICLISFYLNTNQLVSNSKKNIKDDASLPINLTNIKMPTKINLVVLVSSLGRSGSSFVGDLLATRKNMVYFFEPDLKIQHETCSKVSECVVSYLKNILTCWYKPEFEIWLRRRYSLKKYHPSIETCIKDKKCKMNVTIRKLCKDSEFKIVKLIRVRLGFLENLINDQSLNTKIIYLVRDPRAAGLSINKMGWDYSPYRLCSNVQFDLSAYEYLKDRYPTKLFKVQYELISMQPILYAEELLKFAYGEVPISSKTLNFVKEHTETDQLGYMSTKRKSRQHYQKWRWIIPESLLMAIEKEELCQMAFKTLGYNKFNTTVNCKNKTVPYIIHDPKVL